MERVQLRCGEAQASIALHGAELRTWSVNSRDLLWTPDPAVWDSVAPILFPVVGWTRGGKARVDGRTYELGLHGFARQRRFVLVDAAERSCRLEDRSDDKTREVYPFDYRLAIEFRLAASSLKCIAYVGNDGVAPMPYAIGFHPGFVWPAGDPGGILFAETEAPHVPTITADGLFAATPRDVPMQGCRLPLTRELLSNEALCFLGIRSQTFVYEAKTFGQLGVAHENIPHLALWSRPPAPYLCIESWTGHGDPDGFTGELAEKPSMRLLPPGATACHAVAYTFTPPA